MTCFWLGFLKWKTDQHKYKKPVGKKVVKIATLCVLKIDVQTINNLITKSLEIQIFFRIEFRWKFGVVGLFPRFKGALALPKNNSRRVIPSEFEDWRRSTSIKTNVIGIWHYISYTCNSKTISTKEQHVGTSSLLLIIVEGANIFLVPFFKYFCLDVRLYRRDYLLFSASSLTQNKS